MWHLLIFKEEIILDSMSAHREVIGEGELKYSAAGDD